MMASIKQKIHRKITKDDTINLPFKTQYLVEPSKLDYNNASDQNKGNNKTEYMRMLSMLANNVINYLNNSII